MARRAEQIKVDFKRKYEDAESDAFAKVFFAIICYRERILRC